MSENDFQVIIPMKEYKKLIEKAGTQEKEPSKKTKKEVSETAGTTPEQNRRFTTIVVLLVMSLLFSLTSLGIAISQGNFSDGNQGQGRAVVISKKYDKGQSLEKAMKKEDKAKLVLFYVDWCHFCQSFAPTFNKVAKDRTIKQNFAVAWVNVEAPENKKYSEEYGITGFPTLYVVDKNGVKTQIENNLFFNPNSKEQVKDKALEIIGIKTEKK